jgi:PAS domain-containing protein
MTRVVLFPTIIPVTEFPVEIGLNPIETGDGPMVLAAIIDITERKRREDELRRSYERFRLVVESAPSGRIIVGRTGRIELVNAAAERIFGYTRAELLGQPLETIVPERVRAECAEIKASFFADPRPWPMGTRSCLPKRPSDFAPGARCHRLRQRHGNIGLRACQNLALTR